MKKKHNRRNTGKDRSFHDSLPKHICLGFEASLRELTEDLCEKYGDFKSLYLREELFSKYLDDTQVPKTVRSTDAVLKWLEVESNNERTNQRLYLSREDSLGWVSVAKLVSRTRSIIRNILGSFDYDSVLCVGVHTNGASTRVRRSPVAAAYKFDGTAHVSHNALPHWVHIAGDSRLDAQMVEQRESSVMFTVPKKSDIDRVACKEPEINMLLQRSVGKYIRRKLKRKVGIDLRDQTVNQRLAKTALSKGLATVDLSSASDSVTHQLVLALLPWEYYSLMDDLRVKEAEVTLGGKTFIHPLEMFSSMGNGFTFELESLLFYALTRATMELSGIKGELSVYGDDIIAPCSIVPRLGRVLNYFGFTMNAKKTHSKGGFRESCGKHYYNSRDVTPFYVREPISKVSDLIRSLNQLLIWDSEPGSLGFWTDEVARFHKQWANHVPRRLHGGQDPELITALVTGSSPDHIIDLEPPRMRKVLVDGTLRYCKIPMRAPEEGQLTQWLVSAHVREDPYCYPIPRSKRGEDTVQGLIDHSMRVAPCGYETIVVTHHVTGKPRLKRNRDVGKFNNHDIYWVLTPIS